MRTVHIIFEEEAFRKIHTDYKRLPPINKALFDSIATQFALLSSDDRAKLIAKGKEFKEALYNLLNDDEYFFTSVTSSTGDRNRVIHRHSEMKNLIVQTIQS